MAKADIDLKPWADGDLACVFIAADARSEIEKVADTGLREARRCARVASLMSERYVVFGPQNLDEDQYNHEGKISIGQRGVRIFAFKAHQFRLYGAEGSYLGKRAFFATHAVVKKQPKARPRDIRKAAERALEFIDAIEGAQP